MAVLGVPSGLIGLVAPLGFKILDSQPDSSNMGPVPTDFHDFRLFQKSCHGFLTLYLPCFGPGAPDSHFRSFRSEPKRCATKSYADSWWYHLEKCLSCPFRVHLRFPIFGNFGGSLPFDCSNSGSLVFTKFGHQP